jgi:hypothetical protein
MSYNMPRTLNVVCVVKHLIYNIEKRKAASCMYVKNVDKLPNYYLIQTSMFNVISMSCGLCGETFSFHLHKRTAAKMSTYFQSEI